MIKLVPLGPLPGAPVNPQNSTVMGSIEAGFYDGLYLLFGVGL